MAVIGQGYQQDLLDLGDGIFVHPTAQIAPSVMLGPGTVVWAFATLMAGVQTGTHCAIGSNVFVGRDTVLGSAVRIQHGAFIPSRTQIGSRVFIGPNVTMTDDRKPQVNNTHYKAEPPTIENDAAIGAGAVILPGVVLGEGCLIGAGAVVTKSVPRYTTVVGSPARAMAQSIPVMAQSLEGH